MLKKAAVAPKTPKKKPAKKVLKFDPEKEVLVVECGFAYVAAKSRPGACCPTVSTYVALKP